MKEEERGFSPLLPSRKEARVYWAERMGRRTFLRRVGFYALGSSLFFAFLAGQVVKNKKSNLNVLLITVDTLRADRLSCYGSQYPETPAIDRLAQKGTLFVRAFANTTTTLPSHANILLGMTPNAHGVHENLNFLVREERLTLAEHLQKASYSTGAFVGAYALDSRFGLSQGFDTYDDSYSRSHSTNLPSLERKADEVIEAALEWLKGRHPPWFLWVHCWDPHTPYEPPEPFKSEYKEHPYEGEVAYVDQELGRLFAFMEEKGLFDSTVVVLTGDHGESLGQHGEETHGFLAYNSTLWVPLIITLPGGKPGRVVAEVSHIDIFPTVCEVLEIRAPSFLQGISLLPALRGKKLPSRPIYFESLYPYYSLGWAPLRGFIDKGKKFIDSPIPELYDLGRDFDEHENLAPGQDLSSWARKLQDLIRSQTPAGQVQAAQRPDRETRARLESLGYISSSRLPEAEHPGEEKDVKVLLPYLNRTTEAWKLYQEGNEAAAVESLKKIIDENKNIDVAYKYLAAIYQEGGRKAEALATLEKGLLVLPSSYQLFTEYVKLLLSLGEFSQVISAFERTNPREAEVDPVIWNDLGTAYARLGRFEEAIRAYTRGLSLDERYPELYNNLANAYYSSGLRSRDPLTFSRCFNAYKKAIELDPEYPAPYYGLGHAYREEGNLGGAVYCWEKVLELDPGFKEAYPDLALAYLNMGKKDRALVLLNEYKRRYYDSLNAAEKDNLEALIDQCLKR